MLNRCTYLTVNETYFTPEEMGLLRQIAQFRISASTPIDRDVLRRSLGGLSHLPSQDGGELGGKLKLSSYASRLSEFCEEAIFFACRHWLDHEKWFPQISDLRSLAAGYISPEQSAVNRAHMILRAFNGKQPKQRTGNNELCSPEDIARIKAEVDAEFAAKMEGVK